MKPWLLVTSLAAAFCGSAFAQNYSYLPYRMLNTASDPFPYYVDSRASSPGGVSLSVAQVAADTAWASWNAVTCASPKVVSRGLTGNVVPNPGDPANGVNVTPILVTNANDPDYGRVLGSSYVAGLTVPLTYSGVLLNCNIFLNAVGYELSAATPTPSGKMDVQTLMLHEAGHCLGLDHFAQRTNGVQNVMFSSVFTGAQQRELMPPDIQALCERNPLAGPVGSPCYDGGTCDFGGTCYTQNIAGKDHQLCTKGCDVNAREACPLPLTCTASTAAPPATGACLFPSGNVTPVGKACANSSECPSALGKCLTPEPTPSLHQYWAGGYCTQTCETGQAACPAGSTCTLLSDNTNTCLQSCRPGLADCRSSYSCVLTTKGGVCVPSCYTNADCQDTSVDCRTCDGVCVPKQSATAQIGDLCNRDSNCGSGQTCVVVSPVSSANPQCTLQCGRGCGTCPVGSSCIQTLQGLNCLKECSGPDTCPAGLRCADFASGKGCVPVCQQQIDCPVGQHCTGGQCLNDVGPDDGGCGMLCNMSDGGKPVNPMPKDAGTDTTPVRPCGCELTPGSFMLAALGWAVVLMIRRLTWRQ